MIAEGRGNGSVGEGLPGKHKDPSSRLRVRIKELGMVHFCNPSTAEAETGRSLGLINQLA